MQGIKDTSSAIWPRLFRRQRTGAKLANHSGRNDTTFGYIVVDVERLREPMQMITNEFLRLCNAPGQVWFFDIQ